VGTGIEREHRFLGSSSSEGLELKMADKNLFMRHAYYKSDPNFNPAAKRAESKEVQQMKQRLKQESWKREATQRKLQISSGNVPLPTWLSTPHSGSNNNSRKNPSVRDRLKKKLKVGKEKTDGLNEFEWQ